MELPVERLVLLVFCVVFITSVSNCQAPNEGATPRHTGCDYTLKQVKQYFIDGRQPITLCRPTVPCGFQPHDEYGRPNHPFVDYCSCPRDFECKQHDQSCGYFYYYKCINTTEAFLAEIKRVVDNPPDDATETSKQSTETATLALETKDKSEDSQPIKPEDDATKTSKQSIETATPAFESHKDKSEESKPVSEDDATKTSKQSIEIATPAFESHKDKSEDSQPASVERVVKIPHALVAENKFFDPSKAGEQTSEFVQVSVGDEEDYDYEEDKPYDFKILGAVQDAVSEELEDEEHRESSDQSEDSMETAKLPPLLQHQEGKEQAAAETHSEL